MVRGLKSLLPKGIAGQLTLLLALSGFMALVLLFLPFLLRDPRLPKPAMVFVERLVGEADLLDQLDRETQDRVVGNLLLQRRQQFALLEKAPADLIWYFADDESKRSRWSMKGSKLAFSFRSEEQADGRLTFHAYAQLSNGRVLMASRVARGKKPPPFPLLTWGPVFILVIVAFFLIWAGRELVKPLRKLAEASDKFSPENARAYRLSEAGPTEVRKVTRALNDMQDRIHHLIDDRTRMLAAVGHDLRTPVTRMRLRLEMLKDKQLEQDLLGDIETMDRQLDHLLTFFRHGDTGETAIKLDLGSLLESAVNQWADAGYEISLSLQSQVTMTGRPNELLRLFDNLIDNALKYGGGCEIFLEQARGHGHVRFVDHGPGIAADQRDYLMKPFARGSKARTMDQKTGFGLGLSIAKAIAERQAITLSLLHTHGGGLTVQLVFPAGLD